MYLVYINIIIIIGIISLVYSIDNDKDKLINKKNFLIILYLVVVVIFINTIGFINTKNEFNDSTYKIYSLLNSKMNETRYSNEVETIEDVKKLVNLTEEINEHLEVLEYNLRYTEFEGNDEQFYLIIKRLNNYLSRFLSQHYDLYARKIIINEKIRENYSKLKTELNILNGYFRRIHITRRNNFGVRKYYVTSKDEEFNWEEKMEERVEIIKTIVLEDIY